MIGEVGGTGEDWASAPRSGLGASSWGTLGDIEKTRGSSNGFGQKVSRLSVRMGLLYMCKGGKGLSALSNIGNKTLAIKFNTNNIGSSSSSGNSGNIGNIDNFGNIGNIDNIGNSGNIVVRLKIR